MAVNVTGLKPEELKHECDPAQFPFETTEQVESIVGTVGQERAENAIEFALGVKTHGFNLYVSGRPGTGKNSSVLRFTRRRAAEQNPPGDWVYVYNFSDPYRPTAIAMSTGRAPEFERDMEGLIDACRNEIPRAFESENYEKRKSEVVDSIQKQREILLTQLQQQASGLGYSIEMTPIGIATIPMLEGRPLTREEFEKLPDEQKEQIKKNGEVLQDSINSVLAKVRQLEKEASDRVRDLDREIALFAVGHLLEDLRDKYKACEDTCECQEILKYLQQVQEDIVEHIEDFRAQQRPQAPPGVPSAMVEQFSEGTFDRYKVNVFITNKDTKGAPVVIENSPTYYNLIGRIDYKARFGMMTTDHNQIKAGAIHRANGGYLVLQALDVLTNPFSWDALKRALRAKEARVENLGEQYGIIPTSSLRPEPIPLDVKVILVGTPYLYYLLYHLDEDFRKLFKVKSDFDIEMDRNDEHVEKYAQFIATQVRDEGLKHFDRTAVARIVEYGSRLIEDKDRLSTKFLDISDLVAEASYWADQEGAAYVTAEQVQKAINEKEYRSKMIEDKIQRLIEEGTIMIDTHDAVPGQVNALSIYELGDHTFGRPSRITATVGIGRSGIIDIQRETEMGGKIHSKAVMILGGYLTSKYAQDKPLVVSATLAFEQLYEEVEGDSASSTELYSLLSAISGVPIKQGIAVTGSVSQRGEILPIGGVNRKIEGFYAVCKAQGFTGDQGVMVPIQNVRHLMLKDEVIQAVKDGKFHIWPVKSIDEGIEILTGVPAGEQDKDGRYPENSIHDLVQKRLDEFASRVKEFGVTDGFARGKREKPIAAAVKGVDDGEC